MIKIIREKVPRTELLALLAEEASELAQAALKLRRVYDGTNPTPVTEEEALANLKEEMADVGLIVSALGFDRCGQEIFCRQRAKLRRWLLRLKEANHDLP